MPIRSAFEISRFAYKRSRDHTTDPITIDEAARVPADLVKRFDGHDLFVSGDLQNEISRSIENGISRVEMFGPQLIENGSAAARAIAHEANPGGALDFPHEFVGKAREGGERFF